MDELKLIQAIWYEMLAPVIFIPFVILFLIWVVAKLIDFYVDTFIETADAQDIDADTILQDINSYLAGQKRKEKRKNDYSTTYEDGDLITIEEWSNEHDNTNRIN